MTLLEMLGKEQYCSITEHEKIKSDTALVLMGFRANVGHAAKLYCTHGAMSCMCITVTAWLIAWVCWWKVEPAASWQYCWPRWEMACHCHQTKDQTMNGNHLKTEFATLQHGPWLPVYVHDVKPLFSQNSMVLSMLIRWSYNGGLFIS